MVKGFNDYNTENNDYNTYKFLVQSELYNMRTAFLVRVVSVYKDKNLVDVLPVIKGVDGDGNELEQVPIFRIPYFQYRGGINQITITPTVNDYGLCITSDRDITNFKLYKKETKPATLRMFDARDSFYLGGFFNTEKQLHNYLEINDNGVKVRTDGTLTIEVTGETEIISDNSITVVVRKNDKQSSITMNESQIKLEINEQDVETKRQDVTLNDNGLTINAKNLNINVLENMTLEVEGATRLKYGGNCNVIADSSYNVASNKINFTGLSNLGLIFATQGVTQITGQLLASSTTITPPLLREENSANGDLNEGESTKGTLTTAPLDDWNTIKNYFPETDGIRFTIKIATREFEISINPTTVKSINNYQELAQEIQKQVKDVAEVIVTKDLTGKDQITYTTIGTGDIDGYISYMENIVDNYNATSGTLKTGSFTTWENFLHSLNSQNLAFRLTVSGLVYKYQLLYSDFSTKTSFTEFAEYLSSLNDSVIVSVETQNETNVLVFETKEKGSARGRISYMKDTDTPDTQAVFLSGELDDYSTFVENMNNQEFAVETKINNNTVLFYCSYSDLEKYNNYSEFIKNVFSNNLITNTYTSTNKINLTTKMAGNGATFEYFTSVDEVIGTPSVLKTGGLNNFETIKQAYGSGTTNITFYIVVEETRIDYVITPENLNSFSSWDDVASFLEKSSQNLVIAYDKNENVLNFTINEIGKKNLSFLQYEAPAETEPETINGAVLLSGTEDIATLTLGTENVTNINENCIEYLKLTKEYGATIVNGTTASFASDSIFLLKGTEETGAKITQGRDGTIVMINASATWLKGTMEEGAIRFPGTDDGIPDVYDGIAKITGNLLVSDTVEAEKLKINKDTNLTGAIVFNPYDISDEGEVYKKSDVIINGGLIAENATITETANIGKLIINDGVEINGDINLNNSKIKGNGNVLSFDSDGVRNNKMLISTDYKAE